MKKLNNKGFTMIELLAVVTIMGVLTLIAVGSFSRIILNSKRTAYADTALSYIRSAKMKIASKEIKKTLNQEVKILFTNS